MKTTLMKTETFLGKSLRFVSKQEKGVRTALFMLLLLLGAGSVSAQTWDGQGGADTNWNTAANWNPNVVPTSTGAVIIPEGFTVTVSANATCASMVFSANANVASANTLNVNAGITLTVTGTITIQNENNLNRPITFGGAGSIIAAAVQVGGTQGSLTGDATTTLTSNIASITVSGNVNVYGEDQGADDNVSTLFIQSGTFNIGGTLLLDAETSDSPSTLNLSTGSQSAILNMSGATPFTTSGSGNVFSFNGTTASVNYNRLGTQTVLGTTYRNLTTSGNNTKTLAAATTVTGTLTVSAGSTLALSTFAMSPANLSLQGGASSGSSITGTGNLNLAGNISVEDVAGAGTSGATISTPVVLGANRTFTVADDGSSASDLTITGVISSAFGIVKEGIGTMTLTAANSYTGTTTITDGELRLNPLANATLNSQIILNGGTLSTIGITAARTITNTSTLRLAVSSSIDLNSNSHTLSFANSSGVAWAGSTLTINGWTGTGNSSGTSGKIFIGNGLGSLSNAQLAKVVFTGYPGTARLLSTGELVPQATAPVLAVSGTLAHGNSCAGTPTTAITYTVTNTGFNAASGITVNSNNAQFAVSNVSATTIAGSGGTITYQVTFTPSANGAQSATITVGSTTSGSNSPTTIVTGSGTLQPTASAGGTKSICSSDVATLTTGEATATNGTISWSANGTGAGIITNGTTLTPTYTPASSDTTVTLTMTVSNSPCPQATAVYTIIVTPAAIVNAGSNQTICANETVALNGSFGGGATSSTWSAPSGTFSDATSLTPIYTPAVASGNVVLTLTTNNPVGPCNAVSSTLTITVKPIPVTTAVTICQGGASLPMTSATVCALASPIDSGLRDASVGASVTGVGSAAWTNPGNVGAAGSATSSLGFLGTSNYLRATGYGFSIPANATIAGIQVAINRTSTRTFSVGLEDQAVYLVKNNSIQTVENKASGDTWPTSLSVKTYGTATDLWSNSWTPSDINNANFGVVVAATNNATARTATVDYMQIDITYRLPGDINWYTVSAGGSLIGTGFSFDPVGVAGSGLANTNAPGTTVFYAECATNPGCRTPTNYVINALPTVSFTTFASYYCQSAASVNLTANQSGGIFSGAGITNTGAGTATFNPAAAGVGTNVVTYSYTNGNGCTNTTTQNVLINADVTYYADSDGDGFGNLNATQISCTGAPTGFVANSLDCNDNLLTYVDADNDGFGSTVFSACSGITNSTDCNDALLTYIDNDGDGFGSSVLSPCGVSNNTDCNDNDSTKHDSFLFYADTDNDGFGAGPQISVCAVNATTAPTGYSVNDTDCAPTDPNMNAVYPFYVDSDGDTFGSGTAQNVCAVNATTAPTGFSVNDTDCDVNNPALHATFPFYSDSDGDGYGFGTIVNVCALNASTPPANYSINGTDCNDDNAAVHPFATEIAYNLIDDDCDGMIDEGFPPITSTVITCNNNLSAIDSYIYANLVAGAQGYRWRVTTMSGSTAGQIQFIDTPLRAMRITQLSTYAFNTTYKVEVAVYYAGFLQPFTPSNCTATTPATVTQLAACGNTITSLGNVIYANIVPFASGYKFRITDPTNPSNTQELVRATREFRMTLITAFAVQYNKTYNVQVSVRNTDGTYLVYGPTCEVTTPIFPTVGLQMSQCDDYEVPTQSTIIYADSFPGVISYAFQIKGPGLPSDGLVIFRNLRTFSLADFSGLMPGATYNVRVRLIFNANDAAGPYGKNCSIVTPASARNAEVKVKNAFDAVVYPNPFSENFNIDLTTGTTSKVTVKVYDMTGRLLETKNIEASEMKTLEVGSNYPAGVYNVIVSQDDHVKTLRVIKR